LNLDVEFKDLRNELRTLTEHANPALLEVPGVGGDTAAALSIAVGDNGHRIRSSEALASLCGASLIEASSGKTQGHRLNRAGNRQANCALHRIVVVSMSHKHPQTMAYIARRTAEGKSRRSIIRCLKRHVARQIYQALTNPAPVVQRDQLKPRRQTLGLPLRVVAEHFDRTINAFARLENGIVHDTDFSQAYDLWLKEQETASVA
jgi:transposase